MTVTRITEYQTKEGGGNQFKALLTSLLPIVTFANGNQSYKILQNVDNPTRIIVVEVWASKEAHQEAAKKTPVDVLEQSRKLLVKRPTGEYYQ